jgi:hypothetical protein
MAMELGYGARRETGKGMAGRGGEGSPEEESEEVSRGLRGFQGVPRFGLPRGRCRGMANLV